MEHIYIFYKKNTIVKITQLCVYEIFCFEKKRIWSSHMHHTDIGVAESALHT